MIAAGEMLGALCALAAVAACHRRTRRCAVALARYGKAHMSPWMLALFGVCLLVPGPLDELVVLPVLVLLTLRTRRNRVILARYLKVAWSG